MSFQLKTLVKFMAITVVAVSATASMARTFRSADVHNKEFPTNQAVLHMGEELSKATGGKDNVKVFGDSSLAVSYTHLDVYKRQRPNLGQTATAGIGHSGGLGQPRHTQNHSRPDRAGAAPSQVGWYPTLYRAEL